MATSWQATWAQRPVLLIGVLLYVVSWLVPVFQGQDVLRSVGGFAQSLVADAASASGALSGPEWLPGWAACHYAWNVLIQQAQDSESWKHIVVGSTCLTNLAMLAAVLAALRGAGTRVFGVLLLACAVLNASWIYLGGEEFTETLRAGYYLWAGSFVLTGIGLLLHAGPGASSPKHEQEIAVLRARDEARAEAATRTWQART